MQGSCFSEPATAHDNRPGGKHNQAAHAASKPKPGPYYTAPPMGTAQGYPAPAPSGFMAPAASAPYGYNPPQYASYPPPQYGMPPAGSYPGAYPPQHGYGGYPGYPPQVAALPPQGEL